MNDINSAALAIRCAELHYTYARAVDTGNLEKLREIVLDDVKLTRRGETVHGMETFLDVYRAHKELQLPMSRHVITNITAERVDNQIRTQAYFESIMFEEDGTRVLYGDYDDIHVEIGGRLKIAHKNLTVHRVLQLPISETTFAHVTPQ